MPNQHYAIKLSVQKEPGIIEILDGQSKICNWLRNHLLDEAAKLKGAFIKQQDQKVAKTLYSKRGLRNLLPKIKQEKPFLKVVHSSVLKNVALSVSESIRRYQAAKKEKKKVGWPVYRSWKRQWHCLFYDEPDKGFFVEGSLLTISLGMGEDCKQRSLSLTIKDVHLLKDKKIRNLRIVSELEEYYAVFTVEKEEKPLKDIAKVIALDPNHKNFAYGVDLEGKAIEIEAPNWLKSYDRQTDELKAKRDCCNKKAHKVAILDKEGKDTGKFYYKPSRRWSKLNSTLNKSYNKRREQTKTFMYTVANQLIAAYDCVGIGDYVPHGNGVTTKMRRAMNNRSLIGRFKKVLSWVAKKSGKAMVIYDEKGTTRTCRTCLFQVEEGLHPSIRTWQCPDCKTVHLRDENASINGLKKTLVCLTENSGICFPQVSCSDLVVQKRCAWRVLTSGILKKYRGGETVGKPSHSDKKFNEESGISSPAI